MTNDLLLRKFDTLADTPNAVAKLRELVLEFAVKGALTERLPSDTPAAELLARARKQREDLERSGSLRPGRTITSSQQFDSPPLPAGWEWTTLADIALINPRNDAMDDTPATFMPMAGVPQKYGSDALGESRPWGEIKRQFTHFADGDVALAKITPCFQNGKSVVLSGLESGIGAGTTELHVARPFNGSVEARYVWIFLKTPRFLKEGEQVMTGSAGQKRVPSWYFALKPFPLPPLAEQKRIVAKVDELMALCDELEAQQRERAARHAAFQRAAIDTFDDDPAPARLNLLFHPAAPIAPADLRKTILSLAVRAKLVPQDPEDEPVNDMLARNDKRRGERSRGDHRANKENQPLLSADDRWEIADTWEWRALADLVLFVDYRGKTPKKLASGIRLLTAKNVRKGLINLTPEEFLSETEYNAWMTRGLPKVGDVLFTTEAPMGNAAVIDLTERFALAQRVICFQHYGAIDSRFLVMQILSDQFQNLLDKNGTGVTAKGIKASKLKLLPIAIPPLAEQRRIVAKVDELMALVDQLEVELAAERRSAATLLDAVVAELTGKN